MLKNKKKIALLFSLTLLIAAFAHAPQAEAGSGKGLAITGLALGGAALGLSAYNTYQNRRMRDGYYYNNRGVAYHPVNYRRPCNRNAYYGPRYNNAYQRGGYYDPYYDY